MKRSILALVIVTTMILGTTTAQAQCAGDANLDGSVDVVDLLSLLANWGPCDTECGGADTNGDGSIDVVDLLTILAGWGACPSTDCNYDCVEADVFCMFEGGELHPELTCADAGYCCEIPVADPCPETCVENPFVCMQDGGTPLDSYSCDGMSSCCALP